MDEEQAAAEAQFGAAKGSAGQWASCVRCIDPAAGATTCCLELDDNEGAVSMALCTLGSPGSEGTYLAVGTAQGLTFSPRQADGAHPTNLENPGFGASLVRWTYFFTDGTRSTFISCGGAGASPGSLVWLKGYNLTCSDP